MFLISPAQLAISVLAALLIGSNRAQFDPFGLA
jgi:hypothetical protein